MGDGIVERMTQLEEAVRRAVDALTRLREQNSELRREVRRLTDELFRARAEQGRAEGDLRARLGALATLLDRATPEEPHSA